MTDTVKIILEEIDNFNQAIRDSLNSKKISNTGEAADSLRVEVSENAVKSYGIFYLEMLDTGRGPGEFPNKDKIEDWVESKLGIAFEDSDFDSVVFLIMRKISKLGTEIFLNNKKGIELDKKVQNLRSAINEKISESAKIDVIQKLDKFKKKFASKK